MTTTPSSPSSRRRSRASSAVVASLAAVTLSLGLVACSSDNNSDSTASGDSATASSSSAESSSSTTEAWPRTVTTDDGEITIEKKPEKIISTSVTLTGSLLAADAPVVGSMGTRPTEGLTDDKGFFSQWSDVAKERNVKPLYQGEVNLEAIAAESPDLIVVSKVGGDSAFDQVDKLKEIAPVLTIDYSDKGWEQVTEMIGEATGHEEEASKVEATFDDRVKEVKDKISVPEGTVNAVVYNYDEPEKSVMVWTPESAQGRLLDQLGITLTTIPQDLAVAGPGGRKRADVVGLANENFAKGLTGSSTLIFAYGDAAAEDYKQNPLLADTPAVKEDRVWALGDDTFRMDYYSATHVLDQLEKIFAS